MRRIDTVNWLRLSFLLVLAKSQLGHCIQVAPEPKTTNTTEAPQKEAAALAADNATLAGDSELNASERTRRLIPYMAFYLPRDFPINQQYAIQGPKGVSPINGKHSKPLSVQGPLTPTSGGQFQAPQSYMNLRAQPPGIQSNAELMFGPAPSPQQQQQQQQHYLQSAGDIYHQMAYTAAAGPPPPAIPPHSQPATPPLSQSLINTKGSNLPPLHLLPPGPPGPTVEPIIKHRHKTVQHFPPTKPPALQQLPYEHLQPQQLLEPQRHKTHRQPQLKQQQQQQHQQQQQLQPLFVSHQQQQQQQQIAPALSFRQQTRPKQSKVHHLTPFTPTNTLPGHFIPIIYTPVSGNGNDNNNNNNNHDGNALNYDYGHPTVVLVDDLSPPIETANIQQQQNQQQQPEQIQQQFRPSTIQQHNSNEYTLFTPVEIGQQQQQHVQQHQQQQHHHEQQQLQQQQQTQQQQQQERHHHEQQQLQQQQQQQYVTATNAPSTAVLLSSQQAELPTGSAASSSVNPHSTTSTPTNEYIDYIVDDPKQSLDDEQYNPTAPPAVIPPSGNNQDYYDPTGRPTYKQQPTLRLKPISKSNNYATRRPNAPELQPPPPQQHQQPPPPPAQSADKPQYIYADSNFGQKMSKAALKLRPSQKYSAGIGSRLTPPQVAPPATSHQFQETKPANLPQYYNPPVPVAVKTAAPVAATDPNQLPDIRSSSLAEILHKLQASNHLPKTLTPENIDNSIKTLVTILENLKQTQTIVQNPPQHHDRPSASPDYDYSTGSEEVNDGGAPDLSSVLSPIGPNKHPGPSTGRAGIDYPNYADIPQTNFNCGQQRYKGFFGDPETKCQVWHYCDLNGGKASFLCPNGTIFSQIALTCDWWFNVKCSTTAQLYVLNERLYKYILPFTPKFPEDYSGPLVDKYLAMKFQEMEEKMRIEKEKAAEKEANDAAVVPTTYTQPNNNNEIGAVNDSEADAENNDNAPVTAVVDTEVTTVTDARPPQSGVGGGHNKLGTINAHVSEQSSERNFLIDDEVDDISKRGGVDTFESSTIQTAPAVSMKPIVVSSTQIPSYDDENDANTYNVRNVDEATSRTPTTETAQQSVHTTTQTEIQLLQEENQEDVQASPKPVRQAASSNIDVEKVEVIEIKSEGASGQLGPKMFYGAESAKDAR